MKGMTLYPATQQLNDVDDVPYNDWYSQVSIKHAFMADLIN